MKSVPRPLFLLAVLAGAGIGLAGATRSTPPPTSGLVTVARSAEAHELARLRVVHEVLPPLFESYVEPDRLDPEAMFRGALDEVERLLPEVMFLRRPGVLEVEIGDFRGVLDVPTVADARALERELRRVAGLVEEHLDPSDVPPSAVDLDPFAAVEFALGHGLLASLDPHSAVLPPDESREMDQENLGRFGGLGIDIRIDDERLLVEDTLEGSPAARAGVRAGDHVRRIDGQATVNLGVDEAVRLLRGEIGSPVTLEVLHEGASRPDEIVVVRDQIPIHPVEGFLLPGAVAYVRLPGFHATTHSDLVDVLARLTRQEGELRGLVLDLRDNPGGYLREAIAVADTFLDEGEIVSTRGPHDRRPHVELARAPGTQPAYPMIVLTSPTSASASEIVAGALRSHQRAVTLGQRTFGKGSVQNLHALPLDGKLKVTIAHYLTPGERSIQSVGVPADIEIEPVWVGSPKAGQAPELLLLPGERVRREDDLEAHLDRPEVRDDEGPLYRVPLLRDPAGPSPRTRGAPRLEQDWELRLAHELLLVAPSAHRGDMLAAAGPLVRKASALQDRAIVGALAGHRLDWTAGPTPKDPGVAVDVDLGEARALVAGREVPVTIEVANTGLQPLYRVVALTRDHPELEGLEFPIGRLDPGQARRWTHRVTLAPDAVSALRDVRVVVRDGSGSDVGRTTTEVETVGQLPPRLAWSWHVVPPADDGALHAGDVVQVELTVKNVGEGPAFGATARLRNRAGKALDLREGTLRIGTQVDADGRACRPTAPGWASGAPVGDVDVDPARVASRLAPLWPEDCMARLAPGEAWTGRFEVALLESLAQGYPMELVLTDRALDPGWQLDGFGDYLRQEEQVRLHLGPPPPPSALREAPRLDLSVAPGARVLADRATLSGRVSDGDGVEHVVVWLDDEKVEVQSAPPGSTVGALPFSVDLQLAPGTHLLTLLVRDRKGDATVVERYVHRAGDAYQAGVDVR